MGLIVNGEQIKDSQIQQEVERLRPDYKRVFADQDPKMQEAQLLDWSRENVIEKVLIRQEASKRNISIPEVDIESVFAEVKKQCEEKKQDFKELSPENEEKTKQEIELQMKGERLINDIIKDIPEPSEEEISKFYEKNKEQFESPEQIRVAHIVKHLNWQTDEKTACNLLKEAEKELKKGGVFEILAAKYSDCPDNGGDLGYITRGKMVEEFEDVVFNLGIGDVSGIFRTRFGFHIAKLNDRKPAALQTLAEVKKLIIEELKKEKQGKAVDDFVDRLKNKAKIEEVDAA
jgi:parvulin-like peptidyl-prolyl isomerase